MAKATKKIAKKITKAVEEAIKDEAVKASDSKVIKVLRGIFTQRGK